MNLNRRKLLSWFGLGWLASMLPSSLIGCSEATPQASSPITSPESVAAAPSGSFKVIGTIAQLNKDNSLLSEDKKVIVIRDPQNSKKVVALNAKCTHNGCTVQWKEANKVFVCPCHDAEFTASGAVKLGPAKTPLARYNAKLEGEKVLVDA